jgi:hypothetical protein
MNERASRSRRFAERHFAGCVAHCREAEAVHSAVEMLSQKEQADLDPALTVAEVLCYDRSNSYPPALVAGIQKDKDFLAEMDRTAAAEWPYRSGEDALDDVMAYRVLSLMLGSTVSRSTWSPLTVWARSVRAMVDERVRRSGGCSCVDDGRNT